MSYTMTAIVAGSQASVTVSGMAWLNRRRISTFRAWLINACS